MANTFASGTLMEWFAPDVQDYLDDKLVSKPICEMYTGPERVLHNPFNSNPEGSDGVATLNYDVTDFNSTDDTLNVNRRANAAEHIDSIEELQTNYALRSERAERQAYVVMEQIDKYMLNLPVAFSNVEDVDAAYFGGTAGDPYQITTSNAEDVANAIMENLELNRATVDKGVDWVVDPKTKTKIVSYLQSTGNNVADEFIIDGRKALGGFSGRKISDIRVHSSTNLTHEVTLGLATNPTDGDTIVFKVPGDRGIQTVTITFVDTLSGGAGEVHIASSVDITRANLAEFLNAFGKNTEVEATDTGYTALSAADARALKSAQMSTTNDNAADELAIVTQGGIQVSETLTAGGDTFGNVGVHTVALVNGAMLCALPRDGMTSRSFPVSGKHGEEMNTAQVYNGTIWRQNQPQVKDVFLYV